MHKVDWIGPLQFRTQRAMGEERHGYYDEVSARYYDAAYAQLRGPAGDTDFYLGLARQCGGPVLELGCGTGRVLLAIAAEGLDCTGLDVSPAMLAVLRSKALPRNLRSVVAPMQRFDLGDARYALIFSAFRAFQHLVEVEDQLGCLACVRRHLAPGGLFAFDVFVPRLERIAQREEPEQVDARFELDGEQVVRHTRVRRDPARQLMTVAMRYECLRAGRPVRTDGVEFQMRYFHRYELEHLVHRAGFESVEILGGFDGRPYDYVSGETVVLARAES